VNSQAALHEHTATPIPVNINEVSNLPVLTDDIIIAEGEAAAEQFEELGGSTRRQILPMALGLAAARRMYPADDKFGSWLAVSAYSRLGNNDRAAMINIGKHFDEHRTIIVEFLESTDLISPQTIWTELREKVGAPKKPRSVPIVPEGYYDSKPDKPPGNEGLNGSTPPKGDEPEQDEEQSANTPSPPTNEPKGSRTHDLWESGDRFDLVLLTPRERDLKHLLADYGDPQALRRCLPLHLATEEDVAVVIAARVSDLRAITDVLAIYGFKRPSRILLAARPERADVTAAEIFILAERGDVGFSEPEGGWLDGADPIAIAAKLYPDVSRACSCSARPRRRAGSAAAG